MPSNPDGDELQSALLTTLRDVSGQLGAIREQVKEDMAQLLRGYREDVYRTTMAIHARLLSYEDELVKDRTQRNRRQQHLDDRLSTIESNQRFLVRLAVVAGLVAMGVVIGWLVL